MSKAIQEIELPSVDAPLHTDELSAQTGHTVLTSPSSPSSPLAVTVEDHGVAGGGDITRDKSSKAAKSGTVPAIFNFVNSIIGAGIIGLPFALREAGFVGGVLLILLIAICTNYSVQLIVRRGVEVDKHNYEELAAHNLGRFGYQSVAIFMFIFAYGAMLAYLIIIGEEA